MFEKHLEKARQGYYWTSFNPEQKHSMRLLVEKKKKVKIIEKKYLQMKRSVL